MKTDNGKKSKKEEKPGWDSVCGGLDPEIVPMLDRDGNPVKEDEEEDS